MDSSDFSFQQFAEKLDAARRASNKYNYTCCIPDCEIIALRHSHIVSQCVLKKYICNAKHELIQCQIDEVHPMNTVTTGELTLETFVTLGIEKAMSMPLFCSIHDNGLFGEYERNSDAIMPKALRFQVLQSMRAICALRHCAERLLVQNHAKAKSDDFYDANFYEEEKKYCEYQLRRYDANIALLYEAVCKDDFASFEFVCLELDYLNLAICDALVDNVDLEKHCYDDSCAKPLKVLYIHLLPKGNHSYLALLYDKRYVADSQKVLLKKWADGLNEKTDIRTIYDIICHCSNNWCISPDCDEKIIDGLSRNYSIHRMETIMQQNM